MAEEKKRRGRPAKAETSSTPKKRGRPPKPKTEQKSNSAPKKRGRPAKPKTEAKTDSAPKKRGRPAKPKTEAKADSAPKKRGRPAKIKAQETNVTTKRRGRPAKSKNKSSSKSNSVYGTVVGNTPYDLRNGRQRAEKSSHKIVKMPFRGEDIEVELYSEFDFKGFDKKTIIKWYELQNLGRRLDEKAALYLKMAKGWSYHAPVAGHDGIQIALGQIFREKKDYLFPYYRDFLTCLSAGLTPEEIILNGLSKKTDVAGAGRHMSNHFGKPEWNIENVSSCTGNHSQQASGMARAIKKYDGDEVVYYSSGESATAEGYFYEAVSAADFDKSPAIFVLQNNFFGISVPLDEVMNNLVVSNNFRGFSNLKIIEVDGRDVFASYRALEEAKAYVQSGAGPAMIHAECDRLGSHSNSDRHEGYRSDDERNVMLRRDPLMQFRYHVLDKGIMTLEEIEEMEGKTKQIIFDAADAAEAQPDADGKDWPDFIFHEPAYTEADNSEVAIPDDAEKVSLLDGINYALKQEFRSNPNTFLWGQDIGKGGVFNVVKGMPEEFTKHRVFNAQIAEDQIVGTANGFSRYRDDIRVVVEGAEFADYFWPAMEQYLELAHEYWRTNGQSIPNVTLRLASGGYIQGGLYHSQSIEAALVNIPGVRIVYPAFADDAIGLMRNSIRSKGPTMFMEPKFAYNFKPAFGPIPPDDFVIPFGKAKERRSGSDITVIAWGNAVHMSNFAAEELEKEGVSVQIIDLRSLIPWDKETVFNAVRNTNRVVIAHEAAVTGGYGGEIAAEITKNCFADLDAPVNRVGSKDCHVGFAKAYETEIMLQIKDIKAAVLETMNY